MAITFVAHDVPVAFFNISQSSDELKVLIEFHKADLKKLVEHCPEATDFDGQVQDYLNTHFTMYANDQLINWQYESSNQDHYHYNISFVSPFKEEITKVVIKNTCLIDKVLGHTNVIKADLNDTFRGFKMDQDRKSISFEY